MRSGPGERTVRDAARFCRLRHTCKGFAAALGLGELLDGRFYAGSGRAPRLASRPFYLAISFPCELAIDLLSGLPIYSLSGLPIGFVSRLLIGLLLIKIGRAHV